MKNREWKLEIVLVGLLLSCLCSFIAFRIEWFNNQCDNRLPMPTHAGKWRISLLTSLEQEERHYRNELAIRAAEEDREYDFDHPLTPTQQAEIRARATPRMKEEQLNADFRTFVYSWGLYQNLFILALLVIGILCLRRRQRWMRIFGILFFIISMLAIVHAMRLGYLGGIWN